MLEGHSGLKHVQIRVFDRPVTKSRAKHVDIPALTGCHTPECVDPTRRPRGAPNNETPIPERDRVTLGPRVFPTHAIHDVIIPHANKKHENDVIKYYYFFNKSRNNMFLK